MKTVAIILLLCGFGLTQERSPFQNKRFVASEAMMYAGIVSDGLMSRYGTSHHCGIELNPMFARDGGHGFSTGKYFAVNFAIAVPASTVHYFVTKKVRNKWVRGIAHFAVGGFGAAHEREVINWAMLCS